MSTELIVNASLPETRIALLENGEIQELLIERASGKGIVGNIYKGRVTRVLPGMQAAFVDIGLEKAAFLYVDDVYVHSEIWEEEEGSNVEAQGGEAELSGETADVVSSPSVSNEAGNESPKELPAESPEESPTELEDESEDEGNSGPVAMGPNEEPNEEDDQPSGTIAPLSQGVVEVKKEQDPKSETGISTDAQSRGGYAGRNRRPRRGRRGGKGRRRVPGDSSEQSSPEVYPSNYQEQVASEGDTESDRSELDVMGSSEKNEGELSTSERPQRDETQDPRQVSNPTEPGGKKRRPEFKEQRNRDRRIRPKTIRTPRGQVNIQDLLQEGQEVLVQVAKDPIATKGARLTCHISLPGRHLVCMPTIDHVGVSRRIERDDERRKLRDFVDRNRPRNIGFIVRTASGKNQSERRLKQDIDYLTRLWTEIREKATTVTAPSLVYEDLNPILRAIRDWVTEDIDKIIVDSRYHYNDIQRFVSHFMPSLKQKVELYHGDIPILDAYGISTELSRALERKVWLKSGGYIVIDQAEALVAIDVNTGRYVGKKNLEDTILKTNLEAVEEVAYQLRLRNCGGIIIIDLIDMEKEENKYRVYRALEEALKKDRARPTIQKISDLGLIEMTRKRTRDTMIRTLCESCTHCEGKGFIKSKQTVAYEVLREIERVGIDRNINKILVQAHPEVIDILAIEERETLDQLERRYRKQVYLQAVQDFHPEQFEVSSEKRDSAVRPQETNREGSGSRPHSQPQGSRAQVASREIRIEPVVPGVPEVKEEASDEGEFSTSAPSEVISQENGDWDGGEEKKSPIKPTIIIAPVVPVTPLSDSERVVPRDSQRDVHDDSISEEDRLAFLRAQAAQDAALAQLTSSQSRNGPVGGFQRQTRPDGGKNNRGGWQNRGKHRGRRDRNNGRFNGRNDQVRGPQFGRPPVPLSGVPVPLPVPNPVSTLESTPVEPKTGGSQVEGGNTGGSGSGGDVPPSSTGFSQPPV